MAKAAAAAATCAGCELLRKELLIIIGRLAHLSPEDCAHWWATVLAEHAETVTPVVEDLAEETASA